MYRNRYLLDPVKAFRAIRSHSQCGSMPSSQLPLSPLAYLPLGAIGALLCRVAGLACLHLQVLGNPAWSGALTKRGIGDWLRLETRAG
jgi:hypothetical protein